MCEVRTIPAPHPARRAVALAIALAAVQACGPAPRPAPPVRPIELVFPALDGGEIELSRYRGKPVVLHFFSTATLGAQIEAERLQKLHQERGREIEIIGVAMDPDGYRVVAPWRNAMGLTYLVGLATDGLRAGHSPVGKIHQVPTTIVLDRRGGVHTRVDRQLARGELEQLLVDVEPR